MSLKRPMSFETAVATAGLVVEFEIETAVQEQGPQSPWVKELCLVSEKLTQLKLLLFGGSPPANAKGDIMGNEIEVLEGELNSGVSAFEGERAKLFDPNGEQIFAPAEHERRFAPSLDKLKRVIEGIDIRAGALVEQMQQEKLVAQNGDPTLLLGKEELEIASARGPFVKEDCETLSNTELAARCRAILVGQDKASIWLYSRYAEKRYREIKEELKDTRMAPHLKEARADGLGELKVAVEALEEKLFPGRAEAQLKIEQTIQRAISVRMTAQKQLRIADGRDQQIRRDLREQIRSMV